MGKACLHLNNKSRWSSYFLKLCEADVWGCASWHLPPNDFTVIAHLMHNLWQRVYIYHFPNRLLSGCFSHSVISFSDYQQPFSDCLLFCQPLCIRAMPGMSVVFQHVITFTWHLTGINVAFRLDSHLFVSSIQNLFSFLFLSVGKQSGLLVNKIYIGKQLYQMSFALT